ncbi:hypothetical protein H5410_062447 [Solanum commersonii]|uniref:Uncharacterized protein n=1 Tax=Solanum commersonii TaxID=4109 RepID=A0A9J5WAN9_SOLCO|nr:hypothetical protein H5410_062447 [Solanum commersonii]
MISTEREDGSVNSESEWRLRQLLMVSSEREEGSADSESDWRLSQFSMTLQLLTKQNMQRRHGRLIGSNCHRKLFKIPTSPNSETFSCSRNQKPSNVGAMLYPQTVYSWEQLRDCSCGRWSNIIKDNR